MNQRQYSPVKIVLPKDEDEEYPNKLNTKSHEVDIRQKNYGKTGQPSNQNQKQ